MLIVRETIEKVFAQMMGGTTDPLLRHWIATLHTGLLLWLIGE